MTLLNSHCVVAPDCPKTLQVATAFAAEVVMTASGVSIVGVEPIVKSRNIWKYFSWFDNMTSLLQGYIILPVMQPKKSHRMTQWTMSEQSRSHNLKHFAVMGVGSVITFVPKRLSVPRNLYEKKVRSSLSQGLKNVVYRIHFRKNTILSSLHSLCICRRLECLNHTRMIEQTI